MSKDITRIGNSAFSFNQLVDGAKGFIISMLSYDLIVSAAPSNGLGGLISWYMVHYQRLLVLQVFLLNCFTQRKEIVASTCRNWVTFKLLVWWDLKIRELTI